VESAAKHAGDLHKQVCCTLAYPIAHPGLSLAHAHTHTHGHKYAHGHAHQDPLTYEASVRAHSTHAALAVKCQAR